MNGETEMVKPAGSREEAVLLQCPSDRTLNVCTLADWRVPVRLEVASRGISPGARTSIGLEPGVGLMYTGDSLDSLGSRVAAR